MQREDASLVRLADDTQVAAHGQGKVAADCEAQADALGGIAETPLDLNEGIEDRLLLFQRNAGAIVFHREFYAASGGVALQMG